MRYFFLLLKLLIAGVVAQAQNVNIPNANFKAALVADLSINTNADTEIQVSEAVAFGDTLSLTNLAINTFTGIEAFVNLKGLKLADIAYVGSFDISQNTALERLSIKANSSLNWTVNLDISNQSQLKFLSVLVPNIFTNWNNANLDLSSTPLLEEIRLFYPVLDSLDVSNCSNLKLLQIEGANYIELPHPNSIEVLSLSNYYQTDMDSLNLTGSDSLRNLRIQYILYLDEKIEVRFQSIQCLRP